MEAKYIIIFYVLFMPIAYLLGNLLSIFYGNLFSNYNIQKGFLVLIVVMMGFGFIVGGAYRILVEIFITN